MELPLCECGCGKRILTLGKKCLKSHHVLQYIPSKEAMQRLNANNKILFKERGYILSDESKRKIGKANKGRLAGNRNPMKNKEIAKKSLETRRKNGFKKPWLNKKHSEESKQKISNKRLLQVLPFKDTSIERKLQDELSERGYGYYKHYAVMGQPDIAFPDKKIAIFADGDYWHNRENTKKRDMEVNNKLSAQGWLVIRFWEHEINANVDAAVDEIEDVLFLR